MHQLSVLAIVSCLHGSDRFWGHSDVEDMSVWMPLHGDTLQLPQSCMRALGTLRVNSNRQVKDLSALLTESRAMKPCS